MAKQITQDYDGSGDHSGIVNAPAGLPFFPLGAASAGAFALPDPDLQPPKAAIYVGGKGGGGSEGDGAPYDPNGVGSGDNADG
jgi:hypothetical protein